MTYTEKAEKKLSETHDALNMVWTELNMGQRNKLLKNEEIKALLIQYKVIEK